MYLSFTVPGDSGVVDSSFTTSQKFVMDEALAVIAAHG